MLRKVLAALAVVTAALGPAAADYPERPITLIIPFPPGGSTGYTAKVLGDALEAIVKQPVKVEAKTGNFGINAIQDIVGKTDGYTLMVGSIITNSMTPVMHRDKIAFDYDKAIVPITKLASFPSVLMTQPANPAAVIERGIGRKEGEPEHGSGVAQERLDTAEPGGREKPAADSDSTSLHAWVGLIRPTVYSAGTTEKPGSRIRMSCRWSAFSSARKT